MSESAEVVERVAERLFDRLERILNERTTNYAGSVQLLVEGLKDEIGSHAAAMDQLSVLLATVSRQASELSEVLARQGADLAGHELRIRALERPAHGHPATAAD